MERLQGRLRVDQTPEFSVFVFALLLNYPWELIQAPLFEGMAAAPHWEAVKVCTRATFGDGIIMLIAFWAVAVAVRSRRWLLNPRAWQVAAFIAVGVLITIVLEHFATRSSHPLWGWEYSSLMPTLPVLGTGLTPLLQWIMLPGLVLWFSRRQFAGAGKRGDKSR